MPAASPVPATILESKFLAFNKAALRNHQDSSPITEPRHHDYTPIEWRTDGDEPAFPDEPATRHDNDSPSAIPIFKTDSPFHAKSFIVIIAADSNSLADPVTTIFAPNLYSFTLRFELSPNLDTFSTIISTTATTAMLRVR